MESLQQRTRSSLQPISDLFPSTRTTAAAAPAAAASLSSSSSGDWFSSFSFSWTTIIILILLLALVGINVFIYLAHGTTMLAQLVQWFGGHALDVTGDVLQTAGTGAKVGVGAAAGATIGAAKGAAAGASSAIAGSSLPSSLPAASQAKSQTTRAAAPAMATDTEDNADAPTSLAGWREDTLQKALDDASAQLSGGAAAAPRASDLTTTSGKSGWCLVGESRGTGTRTCAPVGVNDVCMSGDIFPTQDVCVNPSLRA